MDEQRQINCDACGRNLMASIGIMTAAFSATINDDPVTRELYPDLQTSIGKTYNVCFACMLRGFRVRI